ncbi:MAG: 2-isopropylmalate synthase [Lachnospiraceae bacterium]|nr:2-isopropylmalate synthase [Lachnospiraceae bacterium]
MKFSKYVPYPQMKMPNRKWPDNVIEKAPIWCSVDLRDGNQALEIPMSLEQKLDFFRFLVKIGFKHIEVGFPAASDTEYEFTRALIEEDLIPDDVTIQVLTQSREHIIKRTFEALKGAKNAIVHLYNSTSTLQRDVVFDFTMDQTVELAVEGAKMIMEEVEKYPETNFVFEYSPESFTGTEMDFAARICNAVADVFEPTPEKKMIINLPSTVEMSTPNIYADQIEYMCEHLERRDSILVSLHAHNDRGTAVASSELGVMAGADRVEGTLFGNGERTGNADILNMALNLFSQGVDPELDFENINEAIDIYQRSTGIMVHPRHPYAGDLVYTAFSGSHQDAIRKGMEKYKERGVETWAVPYLPIDPMDVGRNYDPIIRINSQSGKGGVAFVLEQCYGLHLPKGFQQDLSLLITRISDVNHAEVSSNKIYEVFNKEYVDIRTHVQLERYTEKTIDIDIVEVNADITFNGLEYKISGRGNGVINGFCNALIGFFDRPFVVVDYRQHSLEYGTEARAISYIEIKGAEDSYYGAGTSKNISKSSLRGIVSAFNKYIDGEKEKGNVIKPSVMPNIKINA